MNKPTIFQFYAGVMLIGLLGCTSSTAPNPIPVPTYALDLLPRETAIRPATYVAFIATFQRDSKAATFEGSPKWDLVGTPGYDVGSLTPMENPPLPDPNQRGALYRSPSSLPLGVSRVSFQVRVRTDVGDHSIEAIQTISLDLSAPALREGPGYSPEVSDHRDQ